ncbi:MAG: hypothetical protein KDB10_21480 [Acidimicrobiales bacterium]|nr:hypothetical protein [Acidimicrobiales bacterium]
MTDRGAARARGRRIRRALRTGRLPDDPADDELLWESLASHRAQVQHRRSSLPPLLLVAAGVPVIGGMIRGHLAAVLFGAALVVAGAASLLLGRRSDERWARLEAGLAERRRGLG